MVPTDSAPAVPVEYDLKRLRVPVAVFYGGKDTVIDISALRDVLPACIRWHMEPEYEHLDMIWADTAKDNVFPELVKLLHEATILTQQDIKGLGCGEKFRPQDRRHAPFQKEWQQWSRIEGAWGEREGSLQLVSVIHSPFLAHKRMNTRSLHSSAQASGSMQEW
ncbi:triglyceride lipase-cholesterol esterase [Nannochloropsis gaditana]|uniref:Triglyceride lipase-cholesterol esterase n=1 Tax=Nannochloropsis gaditana TaxID=72520 RepID=W7TF66_9STRA|nr:triglyceride lipase-cholesterol esterase [Nannochloropsis gaditana]